MVGSSLLKGEIPVRSLNGRGDEEISRGRRDDARLCLIGFLAGGGGEDRCASGWGDGEEIVAAVGDGGDGGVSVVVGGGGGVDGMKTVDNGCRLVGEMREARIVDDEDEVRNLMRRTGGLWGAVGDMSSCCWPYSAAFSRSPAMSTGSSDHSGPDWMCRSDGENNSDVDDGWMAVVVGAGFLPFAGVVSAGGETTDVAVVTLLAASLLEALARSAQGLDEGDARRGIGVCGTAGASRTGDALSRSVARPGVGEGDWAGVAGAGHAGGRGRRRRRRGVGARSSLLHVRWE